MYFVYKYTNRINNKVYIGSTNNLPNRIRQHRQNAYNEKGSKYNYPFYCAIRKYGLDSFNFEVVYQNENNDTILRLEKEMIIENFDNSYNQTTETYSPMRDPKVLEKIKQTLGKEVSLVEGNVIVQTWKCLNDCSRETGILATQISEVCRGISKSAKGKVFRYSLNGEIINTDDSGTVQKVPTINNKIVLKIDKSSGEILEEYESTKMAGQANSLDSSAISKVCRGERKTCGGFKWKYK